MLNAMDMSDVKGLCNARRALEIAVAGGHSILLLGPPGCGRTMLARRVTTIMPAMSPEEEAEVERASRAYGLIRGGGRPFYAPHHTTSARSMRMASKVANHGVLFLDEISEFRRLDLRRVNDTLLIGADDICLWHPNFNYFEIVVLLQRTVGLDDVSDQTESSAVIKERVEAAIARRQARGGRDLNLSVLDQIARTIADLAGSEEVLEEHLHEAHALARK